MFLSKLIISLTYKPVPIIIIIIIITLLFWSLLFTSTREKKKI